MTPLTANCLPASCRTTIIPRRVKYISILALCVLAHGALAQQQSASKSQPQTKRDDLDVTMQIIVDPDAKLPDEVVRRIPLPEQRPAAPGAKQPGRQADQPDKADQDSKGNDKGREAQELGREVGQSAKERAKEAAEEREQARRAEAEERRRERERDDRGRPEEPPGRPPGPPGRD